MTISLLLKQFLASTFSVLFEQEHIAVRVITYSLLHYIKLMLISYADLHGIANNLHRGKLERSVQLSVSFNFFPSIKWVCFVEELT